MDGLRPISGPFDNVAVIRKQKQTSAVTGKYIDSSHIAI